MTTTTETRTVEDLDAQVEAMFAEVQPLARYQKIEKLGKGGQGNVYKVRDTKTDRILAAKILNVTDVDGWDEIKRLKRQTDATKRLQHPGIAQVYDDKAQQRDNNWDNQADYVLLMEYVDGGSLQETIKDGRTEDELVDIKNQALEALQYAHGKGVLHRDVKPANVMLTEDGRVKLLDFGLAKILGNSTKMSSVGVAGTINYMAPEVARRGEKPTKESDIYSLYATIIEVARGVPFTGIVDEKDLSRYVDEMTHLSTDFRAELKKGVSVNPEERMEVLECRAIDTDTSLEETLSTESKDEVDKFTWKDHAWTSFAVTAIAGALGGIGSWIYNDYARVIGTWSTVDPWHWIGYGLGAGLVLSSACITKGSQKTYLTENIKQYWTKVKTKGSWKQKLQNFMFTTSSVGAGFYHQLAQSKDPSKAMGMAGLAALLTAAEKMYVKKEARKKKPKNIFRAPY